MSETIGINLVRYVKELYPRLEPSDQTIARYQETLDDLPPIVIARDGVLVDGYHRWQAHLRSGRTVIAAENLGDLADAEIFNESIARNATHGMALSRDDKRALAPKLWQARSHLKVGERIADLVQLLAVSERTVQQWTQDIRAQEKAEQQARAWDLWLNCRSYRDIADAMDGPDEDTIGRWVSAKAQDCANADAPDPHMAFDVWSYGRYDGDNSRFGKLHPGVVENLLWLFTDPGQIVFDPFAGAGTTIHVAKQMGRRVWASDRASAGEYPTLPIHTHDITTGWPVGAPTKVDFVLLDPPYWMQAAGRYSDDRADLGNMNLDDFLAAWSVTVKTCAEHVRASGRLAFIVSPAQDGDLATGRVVDLAWLMYRACEDAGLEVERRIIVPYSTQQATGQQVDAARSHRKLLKLYRDLVVLTA
ncbi:MAG: DNA methyltransferase [Micromonosporaceae bacterium]